MKSLAATIGSTVAIPDGMTLKWRIGLTAATAMSMTMAACFWPEASAPAPEPGSLTQSVEGNWVQGEESAVRVAWHDAHECPLTDWGCEQQASTTTLLGAECTGCQILPRTTTAILASGDEHVVRVLPTSEQQIEIAVTLRFDATGELEEVKVAAQGDREVALEGACRLIDTAALHGATQGQEREVLASLFRSCETPRLASDSVVVFPMIRSARGHALFPFLRATPGERRLRDQLMFSTSGILWARSEALPTRAFAELPSSFSAPPLTITAPLADGATATATLAIPAVR